jgi:DNA-binding XRE family transcriptional regulator
MIVCERRWRLATLRELRERRYITQEELAAKADLSKSSVATLEGGSHKPRLWTIRRLAEVLTINSDEIDWPASDGKTAGDGATPTTAG